MGLVAMGSTYAAAGSLAGAAVAGSVAGVAGAAAQRWSRSRAARRTQ